MYGLSEFMEIVNGLPSGGLSLLGMTQRVQVGTRTYSEYLSVRKYQWGSY